MKRKRSLNLEKVIEEKLDGNIMLIHSKIYTNALCQKLTYLTQFKGNQRKKKRKEKRLSYFLLWIFKKKKN